MKQTKEVKLAENYYTDEYEVVVPKGEVSPSLGKYLDSGHLIVKTDKPFPFGINDFPHRHMGGQEYFIIKFSLSEIREIKLTSLLKIKVLYGSKI